MYKNMETGNELRVIEGGKQPEVAPQTWAGRLKSLLRNNPLARVLRGEILYHVQHSDEQREGLETGRLKPSRTEVTSVVDYLDKEADQKAEEFLERKRQGAANPGNVSFVNERSIPGTKLRRIIINKPQPPSDNAS